MKKIRDLSSHEQSVVMMVAQEMAELKDALNRKQVELQRVLMAMEPKFSDEGVEFRNMAFWVANTVPPEEIQEGPQIEVVRDEE